MVMGSGLKTKNKISFHKRLFISLFLLFVFFLFCLFAFQYHREKIFKAEQLNGKLQIINTRIGDIISEQKPKFSETVCSEILSLVREKQESEFKLLRVTIIDLSGNVVFDTEKDSFFFQNHLNRQEVSAALKNGTAYTVRRHSETTLIDYFYSSQKINGYIIRSAIPYNLSIKELLGVDKVFIWFMLIVATIIVVFIYIFTYKTARNIGQELLLQENEKNRIKRQLTQNINHELKTPISSVRGYLETILCNPEISKEQMFDFVEKSYNQIDRLSQLLKDVATLTRIDEANTLIEKQSVDIREIIQEIINDTALLPDNRRMEVKTNINHPVIVRGNPTLLHSIFENLTDNAIAHSGGRNIFINIIDETEKDCLFSFSDDGTGVEAKHLPRIFERFYRIDKGRSRKLGGTGLGLSIVKNAVIFHGGLITARIAKNGGLEFIFNIMK
jgi:signal transduction histidine kinase